MATPATRLLLALKGGGPTGDAPAPTPGSELIEYEAAELLEYEAGELIEY